MAQNFTVKEHTRYEVEYNIYHDLILRGDIDHPQLTVTDAINGKGTLVAYSGEEADIMIDILLGKVKAVKKSTYDEVVATLIKERKKYADLERDYQYYVKDKTEIFNKREKYINELEDTIHKERKKYAEATKLNDDLHKDLAQWKQMYEEVYACYNHEVDIKRENEELMKERDKFKKELIKRNDEIKTLNQRLGNQRNTIKEHIAQNANLAFENMQLHRDNKILQTGHNTNDVRMIDKLKKELDEEECIRTGFEKKCTNLERENKKLDEIVENQASTIRELEEKNDIQESTIHKLETVISKKSNEIQMKERRLDQQRNTILEHCNRIDNLTEQNRELKKQNDELQKRNEGLCKQVETQEVNLKVFMEENKSFRERNDSLKMRLNNLAGKTYCSEDVYEARILHLENENKKLILNNARAASDTAAALTEAANLRASLKELKKTNNELCTKLESEEFAHNVRYFESENAKLRQDLDDSFAEVKKLSYDKARLIKRQDELTFENAALNDAAKYWREQYEEIEKKRATWRENEYLKRDLIAYTDTIKAQQRALDEIHDELKIARDANETLKKMQAESIKKIEDLETKLKNAQESNGKIWSMYSEQYAKNVVERVPDFGLKMENRRLTIEIESLNKAHQELMNEVANSNRVIERLKKEIERLEKEPTYVQISGFRSGSLVLKLMGENHKLKKERDNALDALSEKDCALAEAQAALMKGRHCYCCPFKS